MNVYEIDLTRDPRWGAFVEGHPKASGIGAQRIDECFLRPAEPTGCDHWTNAI